jgi:arylsulfatase A-like enzyme
LARWPGVIEAGSKSDSLVCLSDVMATYAAITGYQLNDEMGEDSFNAWPAFLGSETVIRESIIHQDITGPLGIRNGKWKLIHAARKTKIDGGEKYAVFDMETDWRESVNLIQSQPETFESLKTLLEKQKADGRTIRHGQPSKPTSSQ